MLVKKKNVSLASRVRSPCSIVDNVRDPDTQIPDMLLSQPCIIAPVFIPHISTRLTRPVAPLLAVSTSLYLLGLLSPLLRDRKSPCGFYFRFRVLAGAAGAGRAQHPRHGEVHRAQVRLVRDIVTVMRVTCVTQSVTYVHNFNVRLNRSPLLLCEER